MLPEKNHPTEPSKEIDLFLDSSQETLEFDSLFTEVIALIPNFATTECEFEDLFDTSAQLESNSLEVEDLETLFDTETLANLDEDLLNGSTNIKLDAVDTDSSVEQEAISDASDDEFVELEQLLAEADINMDTATVAQNSRQIANANYEALEKTLRVPVKHLDNISNIVGELVVYQHSLEQEQEQLQQFLTSLRRRVQQLRDVGRKMQDLYERSMTHTTQISLNAAKRDHAENNLHALSQEMSELLVQVRESTSDLEFNTAETEQVTSQFRQVTNQLQVGLMQLRMVPFAQIVERLPDAVRDIALKCGKQAELHLEGCETLIDQVLLEQLYDPMTHLISNAIAHGIELPGERVARGKSPVGRITICTRLQHGNQIVIAVSDDGSGIDTNCVLTKALEKELISVAEASTMSCSDVYNLLFHPGFSTKNIVDHFSGRGVGMDVVRTNLSKIQGTIHTDSQLGEGTTFTICLPLTLSICKVLCCLHDQVQIAIPMDGVEEIIHVPANSVFVDTAGQPCISWRDSCLPFRPLQEILKYNRQLSQGGYSCNREDTISIVVLHSTDVFVAFQVDQILDEQEIVIKPLAGPVPKPLGVSGATILGDGRVMPVADVKELIDSSMKQVQQEAR